MVNFGSNTYNVDDLNQENLFRLIGPYDIYCRYIGYKIPLGKAINSPLRKDDSPSFVVNEKFLYFDFGTGEKGNCFTLVMRKFGCTYSEALNIINADFGLGFRSRWVVGGAQNTESPSLSPRAILAPLTDSHYERLTPPEYITQERVIRIKSRPLSDKDLLFWTTNYGVTEATLERFNVKSISHYWIDDNCFSIPSTELAYAFRFAPYKYKIYRPTRDRKDHKWYSNASSIIQGLAQLRYSGEFLVITKALKDVMVLYELGIDAIAPQAESIMIPQETMSLLKKKYKTIYTLMDYDTAGIRLSWKMRRYYSTTALFLRSSIWPRGNKYLGAKDISDFIQLHGKEETIRLCKQQCNLYT